MSDSEGRSKFRKFQAPAKCRFCRAKLTMIDWKDSQTLLKLCTGQGKLFSRKRSGNCARHQRQFKRAVKYSRFMGLMPYVAK